MAIAKEEEEEYVSQATPYQSMAVFHSRLLELAMMDKIFSQYVSRFIVKFMTFFFFFPLAE